MKKDKKAYLLGWNIMIFIIICLFFHSCNIQSSYDEREKFIRTYLQKFPKATLQDIYKGNFQDFFGPAHILTNRQAVENYIKREMETAERLEGEDFIPCGWQGNFYQVNLKVIQDGRVPMNEFVDAFMASANGIDTTLTQVWLNEWEQLQQAVRNVVPQLPGFENDSTLLADLLKQGKYVIHHSRIFNENYHPHYRIIRKDIFNKKILPLIRK